MSPRLTLGLLIVLASGADALVLAPALRAAPARRPSPSPALAVAPAAAVRMQIAAPPEKVKIPDKVPQLAPTEPKGDKANQKGKKYKLLLFNDNVNRSAPPPLRHRCRVCRSMQCAHRTEAVLLLACVHVCVCVRPSFPRVHSSSAWSAPWAQA